MAEDWRNTLSFTDRISITSKMQLANTSTDKSEGSKYAKTTEEKIRKSALTYAEYVELCDKEIALLNQAVPAPSTHDLHIYEHIFPNLPNHGARIGKYINAEHFADGIFSEVFRAPAPDLVDGKPLVVALKVTVPHMMNQPHDSRREARILAAAASEHVIPLIESFQQAGDRFVLVFPYMPHDLETLLNSESLPQQSQSVVLHDMFAGLSYLHHNGIIHRDIKPGNILMASPRGPAYLADFGIAWYKMDPDSEPPNDKIRDVGTTCYRSPELLFGSRSYDNKLDMWAAGCVAAQVVCLGSKTLFNAGDMGSELALIKSIFETLGTPHLTVWPEAQDLPDWGKMNFVTYPSRPWEDILSRCDESALDLVKSLIRYELSQRLKADEALTHAYFTS